MAYPTKGRKTTQRLVLLGILTALAMVVSLLEGAFPQPLPGVKPGLANIFSLVALMAFGWKSAVMVTLLRVCLVGVLSGNGFAFLCSLAGGLVSILSVSALYGCWKRQISLPALSVFSALTHSLAQLTLVAFLVGFRPVQWYGPPMLLTSLAAGFGVGFMAQWLLRHLQQIGLLNELEKENYLES